MTSSLGRRMLPGLVALAALTVSLAALAFFAGTALALPPGFSDEKVTSAEAPTAMDFTPDGRMIVAGRTGKLFVYDDGRMGTALDISGRVCSNSERGLLGVTVDPDFTDNGFVYVYYTFNKHGACPTGEPENAKNPVNRVSRFVLADDGTVDPSGEKVLIDNIQSPAGNHNAGDLGFGKDGFLYVSVGDGGMDYARDSGRGGENDAARDRHVMLGKMLRITRDGGIPQGNPFTGTSSGRCNVNGRTVKGKWCREIYATGLRNPFRFAFDPNASGTRFFINDVGQHAWEEISESKKRADYGWNFCEGSRDNPNRAGSVNCRNPYTPPVHEYNHDATGCSSVTGGAFVPNGIWPANNDRSYLFGDYVCNKIFKLTPKSGGGYTRTEFATDLGRGGPVHMEFGPYGEEEALYYATYAGGGEIRRIAHSSTNLAPTSALTADPTFGKDLPLTVNFDGSGSKDANPGDTLTYLWDFDGDGTVDRETDTPKTTYEYTEEGAYTAKLVVRDQRGAESRAVEARVDAGNTPPEPSITAPAEDFLFTVGQEVTLRGEAVDGEDGPMAADELEWEILRHHNNDHTHPFESGTGGGISFTAPAPEDLFSAGPGNFLEVRLTATDSQGLKKTVTRNLQPRRVDVTFRTSPGSLKLRINGQDVKTSRTLTSWPGYRLNVVAPYQEASGRRYAFSRWSDGGDASHAITTPGRNITYVATYEEIARSTSLNLSSSKSLVDYNGTVLLTGRLANGSTTVAGKRVEVWRSMDRGRNWTRHGLATYDGRSRTYKADRRLQRNTLYQMRFAGDSSFRADRSRSVSVRSRAYLSRPAVARTVKKGRNFTIQGRLRPYHGGRTELRLYHRRNGEWRFYKEISAPNRRYEGHTRYAVRYRVPRTGQWYVQAFHNDADHAATRSRKEVFRVVD